MINKNFKLAMSVTMSDGSFISATFGTERTEEDGKLTPDELANYVYESTMDDLKKAVKRDKRIKRIAKKITAAIKKAEKVDIAFEESKK